MKKKSVGPTLFVVTILGALSILIAPLVLDSPDFPSDDENTGVEEEIAEEKIVKISFQEEYGPIPPMSRRQMGAINVDPVKTNCKGCSASIKRMKRFDITIPSWIMSVDSYTLCADGMGCKKYSEMRKRSLDILQPKDQVCKSDMSDTECEKMRLKNTVLMLSVFATAQGQILLFHHGECMDGWDDVSVGDEAKRNDPDVIQKWNNVNWEKNLRVIHKWMNSPDIAEEFMLNIVMKFATKHGPHVKIIGSRYFGKGSHFSWKGYGEDIRKCYKKKMDLKAYNRANLKKRETDEKPAPWNTTVYRDGDILALKSCIFRQETGGSHATFKGRKGAVRQEKAWLKRGITIDLISPEEIEDKFNNAPQPQQSSQPDSGPATEPKPEKGEAPKPAPKKKGDVKKKKEICITGINGKQICI